MRSPRSSSSSPWLSSASGVPPLFAPLRSGTASSITSA